MKIFLIHAYGDSVEVEICPDRNAPKGYIYLIPDKIDFGQWARTQYQIEKDMNDWIRRYDNVLKGLRYWQSR